MAAIKSTTPANAPDVIPSNVIAFPGGRAAAPCLPSARATPHDIERSIARVAAIPAADLLGKAELRYPHGQDHSRQPECAAGRVGGHALLGPMAG